MMPINPPENRLDQMRAAMPQNTAPMPMGGNQTPLNTPPVGSMPPPPPAGGGGPQMVSAAPMGTDAMPAEDNTRLDDLLGSVASEEMMTPEEIAMEGEAGLDIAGGLAEAALNFSGSISGAKAELESALAQLDAMEMAEGLA
tara:strand:+ start:14188 stop:14613 length:426 start_codon:yes stop_codon:yes gene_type:complete